MQVLLVVMTREAVKLQVIIIIFVTLAGRKNCPSSGVRLTVSNKEVTIKWKSEGGWNLCGVHNDAGVTA